MRVHGRSLLLWRVLYHFQQLGQAVGVAGEAEEGFLAARHGGELVLHAGVGGAGEHRVHPDALGRVLGLKLDGVIVHGQLGERVSHGAGQVGQAGTI